MERELTALFGPVVASECWSIPTAVGAGQARKVGKLARMLIKVNDSQRQRAVIEAMPWNDQLLLCRWLADKNYAGDCICKGK